jgi:hypothetical protein
VYLNTSVPDDGDEAAATYAAKAPLLSLSFGAPATVTGCSFKCSVMVMDRPARSGPDVGTKSALLTNNGTRARTSVPLPASADKAKLCEA